MIVSASYKTDIPAFYGTWFLNRLEAGFARVANPWGGPPFTVSLKDEDVDGVVFWTRNLRTFAEHLPSLRRRWPFVVQATITGYPRALETSVVEPARAIADLEDVARIFGPHAAVWRYDPIVVTDLTPPDWHRDTFARLADALAGTVDEVVVSFATLYRKTRRNMAAAARAHGFAWQDPVDDAKKQLLGDLADLAAERHLTLTLCAQPDLLIENVAPARCIDAGRLADVAGHAISATTKGNRPGCLCAESRDIGAYDTCPHGCVYCYAVGSRTRTKKAHAEHDPSCEILAPAETKPQQTAENAEERRGPQRGKVD